MLAKIALLSDYYDCAEAIKLLTSMWVEHHKKTTPIPPEFGYLPITNFIGTVVSQSYDLDEYRSIDYRRPVGIYSFECGIRLIGLLAPYPRAPSFGTSFWEIYLKMHKMKSPKCCTPGSGRHAPPHSCNLSEKV
ncbi:hypothetical protein J3E71DRAFT_360428 [Bipolaris maydis]|nr:hypothetical protein J3E71DRAFT_360428 [Bipolaris maydis]